MPKNPCALLGQQFIYLHFNLVLLLERERERVEIRPNNLILGPSVGTQNFDLCDFTDYY